MCCWKASCWLEADAQQVLIAIAHHIESNAFTAALVVQKTSEATLCTACGRSGSDDVEICTGDGISAKVVDPAAPAHAGDELGEPCILFGRPRQGDDETGTGVVYEATTYQSTSCPSSFTNLSSFAGARSFTVRRFCPIGLSLREAMHKVRSDAVPLAETYRTTAS